jgi:hypothetical protein
VQKFCTNLTALIIIFFLYVPSIFCADNVSLQTQNENKYVQNNDKVLFFVGRSKIDIDRYVKNFNKVPAGFVLDVFIGDINKNSEFTQNFIYLKNKYVFTVMQIGLNIINALDEIPTGYYDKNLDELGELIKNSDRPVYLRIGYEFDYPKNNYDPAKYVRAYKYIVDKFDSKEINNISYVWHSYVWYSANPSMDWYPGDDYVDWFGISYFQGKTSQMDEFVSLAQQHNKPVMIAEASPVNAGVTEGEYSWIIWFKPYFDFIKRKNIKAICYINTDWSKERKYRDKTWADARLERDKFIESEWSNEINKDKYIFANSSLYKDLEYVSYKDRK